MKKNLPTVEYNLVYVLQPNNNISFVTLNVNQELK